MENDKKIKWYKNVWFIGFVLVIVSIIIGSSLSSESTPSQVQSSVNTAIPATTYQTPTTPQPTTYLPKQDITTQQRESNTLSNDNTYTNVDNNEVHSPAYTGNGQAPYGASAQCRDGTYSFSQHRSGTCSHHGGVSRWIN